MGIVRHTYILYSTLTHTPIVERDKKIVRHTYILYSTLTHTPIVERERRERQKDRQTYIHTVLYINTHSYCREREKDRGGTTTTTHNRKKEEEKRSHTYHTHTGQCKWGMYVPTRHSNE